MLVVDPAERISCEEALAHPYLADWQDPLDEPICKTVQLSYLIYMTPWADDADFFDFS